MGSLSEHDKFLLFLFGLICVYYTFLAFVWTRKNPNDSE